MKSILEIKNINGVIKNKEILFVRGNSKERFSLKNMEFVDNEYHLFSSSLMSYRYCEDNLEIYNFTTNCFTIKF